MRAGRGWVLGIGRYSGDVLEWFRIFSLSPRPRHVWDREALSYSGKRTAEGPEEMSLYSGHVVVSCSTPQGEVELAMSPSSLTGFQAWLESGPPGTNWDALASGASVEGSIRMLLEPVSIRKQEWPNQVICMRSTL